MINIIKQTLLTFLVTCSFFTSPCTAQDLNDPTNYMNALSAGQVEMNQTYMAYMSAAAHSTRAKKIDNMRQKALESIISAKYAVTGVPKFKGDNSLRQSSLDYIKLIYNVFNEDYAKIVNLGEIAEQSFDDMQAMLLTMELTDEKINEAAENLSKAEKEFAAKYNVKIDETANEFDGKLGAASKLNHYKNQVYLLFFKCNWQDGKITEALNNKNLTNIEQSRNALISYANEGLKSLDTMKHFEGDAALAVSCRQALTGYRSMAEKDLPKMIEFYLKAENFAKLKKTFDQNNNGNLSKEEIKAFNKSVDEMNAASNAFNQTNSNTNTTRKRIVDNWNSANKDYLDAHMPYYKHK